MDLFFKVSCGTRQRIGEDYGSGRCADADRMGGDFMGFEIPRAFPSSSAINAQCCCTGEGGKKLRLQKKPEKPWMLRPSHSRINHAGLAALLRAEQTAEPNKRLPLSSAALVNSGL